MVGDRAADGAAADDDDARVSIGQGQVPPVRHRLLRQGVYPAKRHGAIQGGPIVG
jgi:hypothetical protein